MKETGLNETKEITTPKIENYKEIHPQKGMTFENAKTYWNNLFSGKLDKEIRTKYEEEAVKHMPAEGFRGKYVDDGKTEKYVPKDSTEAGKVCIEKLKEYGLDGIEYKNFEPDFSKVSEGTVKINHMSENRHDYYDENGMRQEGNYTQADKKCAKLWNIQKKGGRTDWTEKEVDKWRHNPEHHCIWHETSDAKTMNLVPEEIHKFFTHAGGVVMCKIRDGGNKFDD